MSQAKKNSSKKADASGAKKKSSKCQCDTGALSKKTMHMFGTIYDQSYKHYLEIANWAGANKEDRKTIDKRAKEIASRTAWDEVGRYYQKDEKTGKWKKRKVVLPQVDRPHDIRLNPESFISYLKKDRPDLYDKIRAEIIYSFDDSMFTGMDRSTFSVWVNEYSNSRVRGKSVDESKREANKKLRDEGYYQMGDGTWKRKFVKRLSGLVKRPKKMQYLVSDFEEGIEPEVTEPWSETSPPIAKKGIQNPKKKSAKRKAASEPQRLINRCHKLWEAYCKKPTKKGLKAVLVHLEKMKESGSEKVKKERAACLRAASKEAKQLGMK